jgi:acyl carrier protein
MNDVVTSEQLRAQIRTIVAEVLEIDVADLTDASSFADDFEADSLLIIDIIAKFEREFTITVPQDELTDLDDLPAAYAFVERQLSPVGISA